MSFSSISTGLDEIRAHWRSDGDDVIVVDAAGQGYPHTSLHLDRPLAEDLHAQLGALLAAGRPGERVKGEPPSGPSGISSPDEGVR